MSKYSLDRFLESCEADGPLRLRLEYGGDTLESVVPQPFAVVGTDPRADVRVAGELARRAAYLQVVGGRLLCLDLTAGVAGRAGSYPPHGWLDPGRVWSCGPITLSLAGDGSAVRKPRRAEPPQTQVEIAGGSGGACRYRVRGPVALIGRSSQCQVRLRDRAISHFHCALVNTRAGLWAVDLLGFGGVTVNGAATRAAKLDEGDVLRVGTFSFRPLSGASADLVPRRPEGGANQIAPVAEVAPLPLTATSAVDGGPLVALFASLQQQMAEQFRLTVSALLESFGRMHDDQMRLVWHELAEIRRLTEEVTSLKATKAQLPTGSQAAAGVEPARPSAFSPEVWRSNPPDARRAATAPAGLGGEVAAGQRSAAESNVDRSLPQDEDVHAWVTHRIAEVQRKRDGRWQKVMKFLTGTAT